MSQLSNILVYIGSDVLPITPESLDISRKGNNTTIETIALGEVSIVKSKKLTGYTLKNVRLPDKPGRWVNGTWRSPDRLIKSWERKRDSKSPVRFVVTGLDISDTVTIEDIDDSHEYPIAGDKIVSIVLKKYREASIKIVARPNTANSKKKKNANKRTDTRTATKSHTVVYGDTLWDIAKKYLGDGSRYSEITRADGKPITNPNRIFPGEVYNIPDKATA